MYIYVWLKWVCASCIVWWLEWKYSNNYNMHGDKERKEIVIKKTYMFFTTMYQGISSTWSLWEGKQTKKNMIHFFVFPQENLAPKMPLALERTKDGCITSPCCLRSTFKAAVRKRCGSETCLRDKWLQACLWCCPKGKAHPQGELPQQRHH